MFVSAPPGLFQTTRAQALQEFLKCADWMCPEGVDAVTLLQSLCGQPVLFRVGVPAWRARLEAAAPHMCTHGLVLMRPFVPRIATRRLYQRQTLQPMAQYFDAIGFYLQPRVWQPRDRSGQFPTWPLPGVPACASLLALVLPKVPSKSWRVTSERATCRCCWLSVIFKACPCPSEKQQKHEYQLCH